MNVEATPDRVLSSEELETDAAFNGLNRMMEALGNVQYYRWVEQRRKHDAMLMPPRIEFLLMKVRYVVGFSYRNLESRFLLRVPYDPDEEKRLIMFDTTRERDPDRIGRIRLFLGPKPPLKGQKALDVLDDAFPELFSTAQPSS